VPSPLSALARRPAAEVAGEPICVQALTGMVDHEVEDHLGIAGQGRVEGCRPRPVSPSPLWARVPVSARVPSPAGIIVIERHGDHSFKGGQRRNYRRLRAGRKPPAAGQYVDIACGSGQDRCYARTG